MNASTRRMMCAIAVVFAGSSAAVRAPAQTLSFSLSGDGTAPFGVLEDQEIARHDASTGATSPWLTTASGAFFAGDLGGDGKSDVWNDVDALFVAQAGRKVGQVVISLIADLGPFRDGDLLSLSDQGTLQLHTSEDDWIARFGVIDGNLDLDAIHMGADGIYWLSFAENEDSSLLDTDIPGVITDGSILFWNSVSGEIGVVAIEALVSTWVSDALGRGVAIGDVLSVSATPAGALAFSVQSPSDHDGSIFAFDSSASLWVDETDLGFSNTVEMNALSIHVAPIEFMGAAAEPGSINPGETLVVRVFGRPDHDFLLLMGTMRGDSSVYSGEGFRGLALDPVDPLFQFSISAGWKGFAGTTDAGGEGSITFPPLPPGLSMVLFLQPWDLTGHTFGVPLAVDLAR